METQGEQNGARPELVAADREYKRDVAIVQAQPFLKRLFFGVWTVAAGVLVVLFAVAVMTQFLSPYFVKRLIARTENNTAIQHAVSEARAAEPMSIGAVQVFSLNRGEYDFYAEVTNPNPDWYAEFVYSFDTSQGRTARIKGFLLPNETRPLIIFRESFAGRPGNADVVIEDLSWRRVDRKEISELSTWLAEHERFALEDESYAQDVSLGDRVLARSTFTLKNLTPYAYFNPTFYVLLFRGNTIIGVNQVSVPGLTAGESRNVVANWFGGAPTSGLIRLVPNINYFDESVYMPPAGEQDIDIRDRLR